MVHKGGSPQSFFSGSNSGANGEAGAGHFNEDDQPAGLITFEHSNHDRNCTGLDSGQIPGIIYSPM